MSKWATLSGIGRIALFFWAALAERRRRNEFARRARGDRRPTPICRIHIRQLAVDQPGDGPAGRATPITGGLFTGAIAWEALAAVLFWRAIIAYRGRSLGQERMVFTACAVNLATWAAFQVLDEVFLAYQPEQVHRAIFLNQVATIVMLAVLPNMGGTRDRGESDESPTDRILPAE